MHAFLEEIEATLNCGIWSPALASALVVPDACGAIEFPEQRNGQRYAGWYNANVQPFHQIASSGELVWQIRNAMLHEAGMQFGRFGFDRVLFTLPRRDAIVIDQNMVQMEENGPTTLNLDLTWFVRRICAGAETWLNAIQTDAKKQARLDRLLQFRPDGLAPQMIGTPIIA